MIFIVLQFPFHFQTINDYAPPITKPPTPSLKKTVESPKTKLVRFDLDADRRKKPSSAPPKQTAPASLPPESRPTLLPLKPIKSLPLTIFDFNGSSKYYEHMSLFIDTNALHLICINTADFHQTTPANIENVFEENFDISSYPILMQLFQILQLLSEKGMKTNGIMIVPVATFIDLYDKQPKQDK